MKARRDRTPRDLGSGSQWFFRLPISARYGVAVAAAVSAILIRLSLDPVWGNRLPYITLFPAIMLSAWLGGLWPGLLTTILCAGAAEYFWIEPAGSWAVVHTNGLLGLTVFVGVGIVISALNEAWRRGVSAVAESERRLSVTLASIGDAVITTDELGRVTRLNAVAAALTGWAAQDAIGRPLAEVFRILNEGTREPAENPVHRVLQEGVTAGLANHTVLITRDGREIPIDDSAAPIRAEDGRITGVILVFRDITERRRAERERVGLLDAERAARREVEAAMEQLRVAVEAGRMGTWEYHLPAGAVKWSPALEAIHGYAPGTFPGTFEAFREEIHPEDRERVLQAIGQAVAENRDHHIEYRIVRTDGNVRWVEGRGRLFLDEGQQPDRMVGICSDITERKLADERFRLAVEAAPAAMILVDRNGTILLTNALAEQLFGCPRGEIVGRPVERFVPVRSRESHPEHRGSFFASARPRPMGAGRELFALRKDGLEVPVEIGLSPIETSNGVLVLAAITDITSRKKVEEERGRLLQQEQAARAELERASRLKDEFLAVLSHELRTPLSAVLGYAHLLRSGKLPPDKTTHAVEAIHRNAQAQARLVESLLDMSRILAGKLELHRDRVNLADVLGAAVDVIRPEAEAKGIALEVQRANLIVLMGDRGRLEQVLWNLLSNAVKFTPNAGRIAVSMTARPDRVQIQVADTGGGIHAEDLPHIFDRFRQAQRKRDRRAGLGLGLALVREMVQAHGGTVVAESEGEGRGSTFTVTLPILATPDPGPADADRGREPVAWAPGQQVLVVDDNEATRDLLSLLLESRGASVTTAASVAEARAAVRRERPDIVLADLLMPEEDGYSLIRRLRAHEQEHDAIRIPAIAVSANATPAAREEALAAGYDGFVPKPVDPDALGREIARVLLAQAVRESS